MTKGEKQKEAFIQAGLKAWPNISLRHTARMLAVSHTSILYYFKDVAEFRAALVARAISENNTRIIASLILSNDPAISQLSTSQRRAALSAVA